MMYMLGLISSCTSPFLQTYPKMALSPPIGVQISLNGDKNMRAVPGRHRFIGVEKCFLPRSRTASDFLAKMKINQFQ